MYTNTNLDIILDNAPYTDNEGKKYPKSFPKSEISELYQVTETPRPTDSNLIVEGFHIDETYTQVWNTRQKNAGELEAEVKAQAITALQLSDLVAIRCFKAGIEFPTNWKTYVSELRDVMNGVSITLPTQPDYPEGS